ncbi:glutathione S-transferase family protein [Epibacterium sp. SM1969]|uniref:Glutathione S-transferase family protein n=1 Tax=Tritonibacter aquimaris TaxID=2663379 RepID=A0A844AUA2_9RHOB|nr:glutathione binding-like protein [Tritonibacter aquimaris]MQY43407.1 glutathione S-transferase family protein [Tritonibacter aquimaris]
MTPIDLYYWPTPNGWKISIALEEFSLPYRTQLIDIGQGDQFAPAFLSIAPNNRMPAIVDPEGPDGAPVSLFESGAILQYLVRKTGQFGGDTPRAQAEVEQWLMWQMGGLGPMAGQAHHFLKYAPEDITYAKNRYRTEVARLYGVLDRRLSDREFVAGDSYTIADMAIWPWASLWQGQEQDLSDKPNLARWLQDLWQRPALRRGRALHADLRKDRSDSWVVQDLFTK